MRYRITAVTPMNVLFCLSLPMLFFFGGTICFAEDQVVRVEEDWKMVLDVPDPVTVAPQVTCVISPAANLDSLYAAFTLNHRGLPDFIPGGLQLQVWNNEMPLVVRDSPDVSVLSYDGETITWTQAMELNDGSLTFKIVNGHSATWGEFGDQGNLKVSVNSSLTNLNNYNPTVSVKNSGIGFAANRVYSLVLLRVRLITSTGAVIEDNTERVVHNLQ